MSSPAKAPDSPAMGAETPAHGKEPGFLWKSVPAHVWLVALGTALLALVVHFVIRYGFIDNMDEENYLWLSRRILEGRMTAEVPPLGLWDHFEVHWRGMHDGHLYTHFFLMWPLLLAGGTALQVPWLVNPLLATLIVILCYLIAYNLYNDRLVANTMALLLAPCPFLVFQAGTMLSHVSIAMWCLAAALALTLYMKRPRLHYLIVTGVALGLAFSTRPLDAVAFAFPLMVAVMASQYRQPKVLLRNLAVIGIAGLAGMIPFLIYNHAVTGNALVTPYQLHGSPLFSTSLADFIGHSWPKTVSHLSGWGQWFIPWWIVVLCALVLVLRSRLLAGDRVALAVILSIVAAYAPYGAMFDIAGPRYHFLVLFPVLLILARTITMQGWRLAVAGIALVYLSFLWIYYDEGRKMHWAVDEKRSLEVATEAANLERAIVLVPDGWHFRMHARSMLKNEPDFSGIIYALDIPETNPQLLAHFEGVPAYRWSYSPGEPPGLLVPYEAGPN